MEAVAAIGLASAIITFIDFSYKLITGTLEIIDRGTTSENEHTTAIVNNLQTVTDALEVEIKGQTTHEVALKALAAKCKEVSVELQNELDKLVIPSNSRFNRLRALQVTLRSMRKGDNIKKLKIRLDDYRSQIVVCLGSLLNERQVRTSIELANIGGKIDTKSDLLGSKIDTNYGLLVEVEKIQKSLCESFKENSKALEELDKKTRSEIVKLQDTLHALITSKATPTPEIRVLRQLYFPSMFTREDSIHAAESGTFEWILGAEYNPDDGNRLNAREYNRYDFDDEENEFNDYRHEFDEDSSNTSLISRSQYPGFESKYEEIIFGKRMELSYKNQGKAKANLIHWLSNENGTFHISGKAGSGKSTLMKLIAGDTRTEIQLREWAGHNKLVLAKFFAWRSGDDMQQSLYGLYRSILFSVLLQCPDLIPLVFPEAIAAFSIQPCEAHIDGPYFRLPCLHKGLESLFTRCEDGNISLFILIDGLDEFKDDPLEKHTYQSLALELGSWTQHRTTKLLVSSRPETAFDKISPDRRIHLHELNMPDLMKWCRDKFKNRDTFEVVPNYYLALVNRMVQRANGVFMWIVLVIISLPERIKAGESIEKIYQFLDQASAEPLNHLYEKTMNSINWADRDDFYKMIFLVMRCQGSCPILAMAWLDQIFDPEYPISPTTKYLETDESQVALAISRVAKTKGLLEPINLRAYYKLGSDNRAVDFIHRTAYEFFANNERIREISSNFAGFNEAMIITRCQIRHIMLFEDSGEIILDLVGRFENSYHDFGSEENQSQLLTNIGKVAHFRRQSGLPFIKKWYFLRDRGVGTKSSSREQNGDYFSHLHLAASSGCSFKFIRQELEKSPQAMHSTGNLSLLISAIYGYARFISRHNQNYSPITDFSLFEYLLDKGVSPFEEVEVQAEDISTGESRDTGYKISAWTFLLYMFALGSIGFVPTKRLYPILERFLRTGVVDTNAIFIFLYRIESENFDRYTFTTLKELIRVSEPENPSVLNESLNRSQKRNGKACHKWIEPIYYALEAMVRYVLPENLGARLYEAYNLMIIRGFWTLMLLTGLSSFLSNETQPISKIPSPDYTNLQFDNEEISALKPVYHPLGLKPPDYGNYFLHAILSGEKITWIRRNDYVRIY